jgi:hypothetical protein
MSSPLNDVDIKLNAVVFDDGQYDKSVSHSHFPMIGFILLEIALRFGVFTNKVIK